MAIRFGEWKTHLSVTPMSTEGGIQPALEKVGLGHVNFQILRRSWVTEFSQVESDAHVRAQIAGHSVDVHENEYRQKENFRVDAAIDGQVR